MVLILAAITLAGSALVRLPGPADAQLHGATRSFSATEVEPGGILEVSVFAADFGSFGQLLETLPPGFVYVGSDLPDSAVTAVAKERTLSFLLLETKAFTYTVIAPYEEGDYNFSGIIKDQGKQERSLSGADTVRVGLQPALFGEENPRPRRPREHFRGRFLNPGTPQPRRRRNRNRNRPFPQQFPRRSQLQRRRLQRPRQRRRYPRPPFLRARHPGNRQ